MKLRALRLLLTFALLLVVATGFAQETGQLAWRYLDSASVRGKFIQTDYLGHIYVLEETAVSTSLLNIYDKFGNLVTTYPINRVVSGLQVEPFTGTALISGGNGMEAFYWDGEGFIAGAVGTLLATSFDQLGRVVAVYSQSGSTDIDTFTGEATTTTHVAVPATSAVVDESGRVLLVGYVSGTGGDIFANYYGVDGSLLWTRTYTSSSKSLCQVAAFHTDILGLGYLMMNRYEAGLHLHYGWVECIDPANGSTERWQSPNITGTLTYEIADQPVVFIAGSGKLPFLAGLNATTGAVAWSKTQRVDGLARANLGPVAEAYDPTGRVVRFTAYGASDGAVLSSLAASAPTQQDMGPIDVARGTDLVYAGSTGGTTPVALIAQFAYGSTLKSFAIPSSVLGGASIDASLGLTNTQLPIDVDWLTSNSRAIPALPKRQFYLLTTVFQIPTLAVDKDTSVTYTAQQTERGIRRAAKTVVKTASLESLAFSASSLGPNQTATATLKFNGVTGPSGKAVTIVSDNPAATAPSKLSVVAGKSSGTFTVTTHPVAATTLVTISATCEGHTVSQTLTVTK